MIFKILLPVLVGLLIYFLGKSHARRNAVPTPVPRSSSPALAEKFRISFRLAAYSLVVATLLSALLMVYEGWQTDHKPVVVRVINVQTGASAVYQALQGQVHGRTFHTLDGRQIRLADVERMEVEE